MSCREQFYIAPLESITVDVKGSAFAPIDDLVESILNFKNYDRIQGRRIGLDLPWGIKRKE
jgi:hypothetical protein